MRKAPSVVVIGILALVLGLVGFFVLSVFVPTRHVTKRPLSLAEFTAEFNRSDFPATARNICFASAGVGLGGRALVFRFDAPVPDCIAFAKAEFERYSRILFRNPSEYPSSDPVPVDFVNDRPRKPDLSVFWLNNLDWFDVDRIEEGVTIPLSSRGHHPTIWIDTRRGTLYEWWTD